jgi:AcrR family transcriptional regulator
MLLTLMTNQSLTMSPDFNSHCPFRRRRKEARPAELLEAALKLFVEKGFAATRSEEVARAAGVSKGTLYLYFPSKEELLKAVIQHFLADEIAAGAAEAASADGPTPQVMEELLVSWWMRMYDSPASGVFKLVITEVRNFPEIARFYVERVIRPGHELVGGLLARGIERGEFQAVDIETASQSILMPLVMLCIHKHSMGACGIADACGGQLDSDPASFVRAHLRLVFRGLEVRTPERSVRNPPRVAEAPPPSGGRRAA